MFDKFDTSNVHDIRLETRSWSLGSRTHPPMRGTIGRLALIALLATAAPARARNLVDVAVDRAGESAGVCDPIDPPAACSPGRTTSLRSPTPPPQPGTA